jgi:hypothetical protein
MGLGDPSGRESIPQLVEALREIHMRRTAQAPSSPSLLRGIDSQPQGALPAPLLFLENIARANEQSARLLPQSSSLSQNPLAAGYARLREHFGEIERAARQHKESINREAERQRPAGATAARTAFYQQTVYLQCEAGGRTAGRFRCINSSTERARVTSSLRSCTLNGDPLDAVPAITLCPGAFSLEPGAATIVAVEVDCTVCKALREGTIQTSVDLHMDDCLALKVWIEITLHE